MSKCIIAWGARNLISAQVATRKPPRVRAQRQKGTLRRRPPPATHEHGEPLPVDLRRNHKAFGTDGVEQLQGLHARRGAQVGDDVSGIRGQQRRRDARHQLLPRQRAELLKGREQLARRVDEIRAGDGRRAHGQRGGAQRGARRGPVDAHRYRQALREQCGCVVADGLVFVVVVERTVADVLTTIAGCGFAAGAAESIISSVLCI